MNACRNCTYISTGRVASAIFISNLTGARLPPPARLTEALCYPRACTNSLRRSSKIWTRHCGYPASFL